MSRLFLVALLVAPSIANAAQANDLRNLRVGMPVAQLPATGYGSFSCSDDPAHKLGTWADYKSCPVTKGLQSVSFKYDDPQGDATKVGGQAVNLAVLIDNRANVAGLRIDTDPHTRLYVHKKAYLFALQVKARFGEDGWTCQKSDPTPSEQPVGGVFIKEHCEKTTAERHFVLNRELYRDPGEKLQDFTDATQLTILRPDVAE